MAPRVAKRPVTLSDAFGVEEDRDSNLPKDAKMSRNLGSVTATAAQNGQDQGKRSAAGGQGGAPSMYWQQQLNSLRQSAENTRPDGSSVIASGMAPSVGIHTHLTDKLPPRRHHADVPCSGSSAPAVSPPAVITNVSGSASVAAAPAGGFAFPGAAPPSTAPASGVAAASPCLHSPLETIRPLPLAAVAPSNGCNVSPLYVCWICRRKLDGRDNFDHHVLHSRLHQETIRRIAGLA
mmetsp:Transcript_36629/g.85227  ORF Transcript_36629/g.85227 Transcript_36629/m.85227 type:complete len:236 (+) Transcript_36629:62-769(+)